MKDKVDTLIVVSNDKLLEIVPEGTPLTQAFLVADEILRYTRLPKQITIKVCGKSIFFACQSLHSCTLFPWVTSVDEQNGSPP